ncbi:MAG: hypothetical protein ACYDHH_11340 [Solirubrobacteraceae bacterium]
MTKRTDSRRRWALGAPFRRRRAARDAPRGFELTPVADSATPDLLGDLGRRLDEARVRLRDAIPPPAD